MPKRYLLIIVFSVFLLLTAAIGYMSPAQKEEMPVRVLLDNMAGKVIFEHEKHIREYNLSCETCHHETKTPRQNVLQCGTCHGAATTAEFKQNHATDIQDPAACAWCHHKAVTPAVWRHNDHVQKNNLQCWDCHNTEKEQQHPHAMCIDCHESVLTRGTKDCSFCHGFVNNRKNFAAGKDTLIRGNANCMECHQGKTVKELIPNRMAAFHGSCIKCHEQRAQGPYEKGQCQQCHLK